MKSNPNLVEPQSAVVVEESAQPPSPELPEESVKDITFKARVCLERLMLANAEMVAALKKLVGTGK